MGKIITFGLGLGVAGLVFGYLVFGRIAGEYIGLDTLFQSSSNVLEDAFRSLTGLKEARQNILISGGVGAVLGLVVGAVLSRRA